MSLDIGLDSSGDLPARTAILSGTDTTVQRIRRRLQTHRGEFLADKSVGVPWASWVASRRFPLDEAAAWIRAEIETCPGVVRVDEITSAQDGEAVVFTGTVVLLDATVRFELLPVGAPGTPNRSASFRLLTGPGRRS